MPPQYENVAPIDSFAGIVLASKPELIPDNGLQECNNFLLGQYGELIKRPFRSPISGQTAPPATTFVNAFLGQAIGFENNKVFYANEASVPYHCDTSFANHTQITGILNATKAVQYKLKMYICGAGGIYEWTTGTTATLIAGSPTNCIGMILKDNRLFAISGSRVYYCAAGDALTWLSGGSPMFVQVADGDGEVCTGIVTIGDRIIVFKNSSIHVIYAQDEPANWTVRQVSPDVGCVGPRACLNSKGLIYFLALDGLWITDGVAVSRISDPISPIFQYRGRNNAAKDTISVYEDYLLLKIQCNGYWGPGYTTLAYRYTGGNLKGFTEVRNLLGKIGIDSANDYPASLQKIVPSGVSGAPFYVIFSNDTTFYRLVDSVAEQGGESTVPETVRCFLKTKAFNFEAPTRYKRLMYTVLALYAESPVNPGTGGTRPAPAGLKYSYVVDNFQADVIDLWQEGIFGARNFKLRGSGMGRAHTFVFTEESKATNLQVLGVNFIYQLARQQDRQNL